MKASERQKLKDDFRGLVRDACEQAAKAERARVALEPVEAEFMRLSRVSQAEELAFYRLWADICRCTWEHYAGGPITDAELAKERAAE